MADSNIKANYRRWPAIYLGEISQTPKGTSTPPKGHVRVSAK